MRTSHSKHLASFKRAKKVTNSIEAKYPDINFYSNELYNDFIKHHEYAKKRIYAQVNMTCCKSDNRFMRCENCICGKN